MHSAFTKNKTKTELTLFSQMFGEVPDACEVAAVSVAFVRVGKVDEKSATKIPISGI